MSLFNPLAAGGIATLYNLYYAIAKLFVSLYDIYE
jgi:hypothetical protein